jgi:hypothetical protein
MDLSRGLGDVYKRQKQMFPRESHLLMSIER